MARWAITKGQAVDSRSRAGSVVAVNQQTPSTWPAKVSVKCRETDGVQPTMIVYAWGAVFCLRRS